MFKFAIEMYQFAVHMFKFVDLPFIIAGRKNHFWRPKEILQIIFDVWKK